jgi:hypothetical protein
MIHNMVYDIYDTIRYMIKYDTIDRYYMIMVIVVVRVVVAEAEAALMVMIIASIAF